MPKIIKGFGRIVLYFTITIIMACSLEDGSAPYDQKRASLSYEDAKEADPSLIIDSIQEEQSKNMDSFSIAVVKNGSLLKLSSEQEQEVEIHIRSVLLSSNGRSKKKILASDWTSVVIKKDYVMVEYHERQLFNITARSNTEVKAILIDLSEKDEIWVRSSETHYSPFILLDQELKSRLVSCLDTITEIE